MSQAKVRAAIETRLKDWADASDLTVAWEDVAFAPAPDQTWLRFTLMPAATESPDLAGDIRTYSGVAQVSVFVPSGKGPSVAEGHLAELDALFSDGDVLAADGFDVYIVSPVSAGPYQQDDLYSMLPVSFRYRADVLVS